MTRRRVALAGLAAVTVAPPRFAWAIAAPASDSRFPDLHFQVLRDGGSIGHHDVTFTQANGALTASTVVTIEVRFAGVVLYRYAQSARETWRDGEFEELVSETDDNGRHHAVRATREATGVIVRTASASPVSLPADAIPMTNWNILCVKRPVFNVMDGSAIASKVVPRGENMVTLANGDSLRAARYSFIGSFAVDDCYDDADHWAALRMTGSDGSIIQYRRAA